MTDSEILSSHDEQDDDFGLTDEDEDELEQLSGPKQEDEQLTDLPSGQSEQQKSKEGEEEEPQ